MMSEDTARSVGAKGDMTVKIGDKDCQVRPLSIAELGELERDCLSRYKRTYLKTFKDNEDLIPDYAKFIEKKLEETAKWDVSDLPPKTAYDSQKIKVTKNLKSWLIQNMELELKDADGKKLSDADADERIKSMAGLALDSKELAEEDYKILTDSVPRKVQVGYVNWWITGAFDGMISMIHICFRGNNLSREEIIEAIGDNPNILSEATRKIEELSAPQQGNG